jgi:hypothetical protein
LPARSVSKLAAPPDRDDELVELLLELDELLDDELLDDELLDDELLDDELLDDELPTDGGAKLLDELLDDEVVTVVGLVSVSQPETSAPPAARAPLERAIRNSRRRDRRSDSVTSAVR